MFKRLAVSRALICRILRRCANLIGTGRVKENQEWENPHDPDARLPDKTARRHDLQAGAVVDLERSVRASAGELGDESDHKTFGADLERSRISIGPVRKVDT